MPQESEPRPDYRPDYKSYLGDGVYADFDGYQIVLKTDGNTIYLEPAVIEALERYVKKLKEGN